MAAMKPACKDCKWWGKVKYDNGWALCDLFFNPLEALKSGVKFQRFEGGDAWIETAPDFFCAAWTPKPEAE